MINARFCPLGFRDIPGSPRGACIDAVTWQKNVNFMNRCIFTTVKKFQEAILDNRLYRITGYSWTMLPHLAFRMLLCRDAESFHLGQVLNIILFGFFTIGIVGSLT